jgi:hypothetical protein
MFKYICEKLGFNFSSERNQSPNPKAVAKSKYEKAAATTGNYSPIQMLEGDINIINTSPTVLAVDDHKSWEELLQCFSDRTINMIIDNYTKDRRIAKDLENAFGWQKYLIGKFDKIQIFQKDIRANAFINIKTKTIEALNSFMYSKNCEQFKLTWLSFREELASIRDDKV